MVSLSTSADARPTPLPAPDPSTLARLPESEPPRLLVVVDTEEEFDWARPLDRANVDVTAIAHVERAQRVFDRFGIRPCYVVDYPVAATPSSATVLGAIRAEGRCTIGAHLHPWVNPPHEEPVNPFNSYPGNLDEPLESAKLSALRERISESFGAPPTAYKAGRYGIGRRTPAILARLGFTVDLSPAPAFDYTGDGGPDFARFPNHPFWLDRDAHVLSIPCTGAFVGLLGEAGAPIHRAASSSLAMRVRTPGILARSGLLERIRLSPEGFTFDELVRITRYLLDRGVRVLTLSFHSPSVAPGMTPYVRDAGELDRFIGCIERYCEHFLGELGGIAATPDEVRDRLLACSTLTSPPHGANRERTGRATDGALS